MKPMSLEENIKHVLADFENTDPNKILDVLRQIQPHFKSQLTSEYLQGKIQKILDLDNESEKKKQCKTLTPYLDWYLQGL